MLEPVGLSQQGASKLQIQWKDGHESLHTVRQIRALCECAQCVDEWTRKRNVSLSDISPDIKPKLITTVGRYAFHIEWSDGHSTGIYSFDKIRRLCECPTCTQPSNS